MTVAIADTEKYWTQRAHRFLVGATIKEVRYMSEAEAEEMGWYGRPLAILLSDGTWLFASADDEGNNGGALFTTNPHEQCFPVI